ncbi:EAL domain-containing protein [Aeromonas veronii]|uniref:EAL domain-containing protein n=1 Tax=Aeromonas veronii TaxID=654 RepID=UPI003BA1831B
MQHDLATFPSDLIEPLEISVNLSSSMFTMGLAAQLDENMREGPLSLQQLIVELTETIALDDIELSKQIIDTLRQIGVRVVAEGVENNDELKAVLSIGVDEIQGYFYSRPLPLQDFLLFCHRYFINRSIMQEVALG